MDITAVTPASTKVTPGTLFVAIKGYAADGHEFIEEAFDKGAVIVIAQTLPENSTHADRIILVENGRKALAAIAAQFYGHPSRDLTLIGVTGTNGKTTTTWILEHIFNACGFAVGVIGTVNIRYAGNTYDNPITTPDAVDLQSTLAKMKEQGITHVIMEVSSHGLDLFRVDFCDFDIGIFTNLSQDHLDHHRSMDAYFDCKKRLFTQLLPASRKENSTAILNLDDNHVKTLARQIAVPTIGFSTCTNADISAHDFTCDINGIAGSISSTKQTVKFSSSLIGRFNLENILSAASAALALNVDPAAIQKGIENCRSIPGRLEKVNNALNRFFFVDYAHTPDALESVLTTLGSIAPKRVITLFGCGGDRDRSKRPVMGRIAAQNSDIAIVTSDNPRNEDPDAIIIDICKGLDGHHSLTETSVISHPFQKGFLVEPNRKKAIEMAISISKPGDIVLAAGKGHETYQITRQGKIFFDDRQTLETAGKKFSEQFDPLSWTVKDLADALNCNPDASDNAYHIQFDRIATDSRLIEKNQLFVALKGDTFDGHAFVEPLIDKGIKGFVVEKGFIEAAKDPLKGKITQNQIILFETQNTLLALGQLAKFHRNRTHIKVLAITGSSGKTTTRKICESIFQTSFHTLATQGNFNNEIGLPLTLLNLSQAHEWAVIEMGMNHMGEISRLTRIARPDIAIITNIAGVHLEGVGTIDNVARAKAEIFEGMGAHSTAILPGDDRKRAILESNARDNKNIDQILFFGSPETSDMSGTCITSTLDSTKFSVKLDTDSHDFDIPSPASFMVNNCLAAICAARTAGISITGMQKGIKAFEPVGGRMNICPLNWNGFPEAVHLIDDTYNANPASVTAALTTLAQTGQGKNSMAVLGDMLELGDDTERFHREIGQKAASLNIDYLYVYGELGRHIVDGAKKSNFPEERIFYGSKDEISQKVIEHLKPDTWILIKGSRGMKMETVIQQLKRKMMKKQI